MVILPHRRAHFRAAPAETDPYFANVSLLLHLDSDFTDSSPSPKTVTANGNAQISNAQSKWGGASALFDGTGDSASTPYSTTPFDWWSTDYTLETWVYINDLATMSYNDGGVLKSVLIGNANPASADNYWSFGPLSDGKVRLSYYNGSSQTITSTATVGTGAWNYLAFKKTASGVIIAVNTTLTTVEAVSGTPQSSVSQPLIIGQINNRSMNCYIDDVRITKGVARDISSLPTAAFPNS